MMAKHRWLPIGGLILVLNLGLVTGCMHNRNRAEDDSGKAAQAAPASPFKISYFSSAEASYDRIELEGPNLTYTYFDDEKQSCAQWVQQAPCWTAEQLKSRSIRLTDAQLDELQQLIRSSGFMSLDDSYGKAGETQRYYGYTLSVELGGQKKAVLYQSFPGAEPMPEAFARLEDKLMEIVNS